MVVRHTGYNGPFAVIRKRKGQNRKTRREYNHLSRWTAYRLSKLRDAGKITLIRDKNFELFYQFFS